MVAEALGLTVTHAALSPSGQPVWLDMARRSAQALVRMEAAGLTVADILTEDAVHNAMVVHAAFGGSTNLLLHIPAIAYAAGLRRPVMEDWAAINRAVPRLVDVLPNGPVRPSHGAGLSGGRRAGGDAAPARDGPAAPGRAHRPGRHLGEVLDAWEGSERRARLRDRLRELDGIDPDDSDYEPGPRQRTRPDQHGHLPARQPGPAGRGGQEHRHRPQRGRRRRRLPQTRPGARLYQRARDDRRHQGHHGEQSIQPGDVIVLMGRGPLGSGMEETYQVTAALKHLPWGKEVALITDARFSGVSTGACIGHVGPEALAGGPLGRVREGDQIQIVIDRIALSGSLDLVGEGERSFGPEEGAAVLAARPPHPDLAPDPDLPDDTRLWAALQNLGGGTWGGCVYDVDAIIAAIQQKTTDHEVHEGHKA